MDKPINLYMGNYANVSPNAPAVIQQETIWLGERCIIYAPAASLLSGGAEEISFGMSEHAEQRKLSQEKQRLLSTPRKKYVSIGKVKAKGGVNDRLSKQKDHSSDDL